MISALYRDIFHLPFILARLDMQYGGVNYQLCNQRRIRHDLSGNVEFRECQKISQLNQNSQTRL